MKRFFYGFTLIELLVVISVLAILGAFGFAALVNYSRTQTLKSAARDLRTHLRLAQNKAIVQEKPSTGCPQLIGYKLQFVTLQRYNIYRVCRDVLDVSIREFNLPQTIRNIAAGENEIVVDFLVSSGRLNNPNPMTLTLTSDFGGSENIVITREGIIQ